MRQLVAGPDHEPHAFAECNGSKLWRVLDSRSNEPSECFDLAAVERGDWTSKEDQRLASVWRKRWPEKAKASPSRKLGL